MNQILRFLLAFFFCISLIAPSVVQLALIDSDYSVAITNPLEEEEKRQKEVVLNEFEVEVHQIYEARSIVFPSYIIGNCQFTHDILVPPPELTV